MEIREIKNYSFWYSESPTLHFDGEPYLSWSEIDVALFVLIVPNAISTISHSLSTFKISL